MPRPKNKAVTVAASNPYAMPEQGEKPRGFVRGQTKPRVPVTKFITPPASTVPKLRANGHVLTDRGWVREEGHDNG